MPPRVSAAHKGGAEGRRKQETAQQPQPVKAETVGGVDGASYRDTLGPDDSISVVIGGGGTKGPTQC